MDLINAEPESAVKPGLENNLNGAQTALETSLDAVRAYISAGCSSHPVPLGRKRPNYDNWQNISFSFANNGSIKSLLKGIADADYTAKLNASSRNIGLKLGDKSNGICDVDLDWPEAKLVASLCLPMQVTFGRTRSPISHVLLRCDKPQSTIKFGIPKAIADSMGLDGNDPHACCVLELRSSGGQTIVPPGLWSGKKDGEQIEPDKLEPITWTSGTTSTNLARIPSMSWEDAVRAAGLAATLAVLLRYYPQAGTRNDYCLAVTGAIINAGYDEAEADKIIAALVEHSGDDGKLTERQSGEAAAKKPRRTGLPTACKIAGLPKEIVPLLKQWLKGSATEEEEPAKLVTIKASDIEPEPLKWLWPGRFLYGYPNLIVGPGEHGKSTLVLGELVSIISRGGALPFNEGKVEPGAALIISGEEGAKDIIINRLIAHNANLENVHVLEEVTSKDKRGNMLCRSLDLSRDVSCIEEFAEKVGNLSLVVIDPINAFMGKANTNLDSSVRDIFMPLTKLINKLGIALVGITHFNKNSKEENANYRVMGSGAYFNASRTCNAVHKDPDSEARYLLPMKSNEGIKPNGLHFEIRERKNEFGISCKGLVWVGVTETTADVLLAQKKAGRPNDAEKECLDMIQAILGREEYKVTGAEGRDVVKEVREETGHGRATVHRAAKKLDELGLIERPNGGLWKIVERTEF